MLFMVAGTTGLFVRSKVTVRAASWSRPALLSTPKSSQTVVTSPPVVPAFPWLIAIRGSVVPAAIPKWPRLIVVAWSIPIATVG